MDRDINTVVATITGRIASLDKVKGNLEAALRRADADLAAMVATESAPARAKRSTAASNGGSVMSTNGASAGPT